MIVAQQAASSSDPEPFLLVDTLGLLAVDHHALPAQQDVQTAIAEPATLVGQLAQLLTQTGIIVPRGTVTLRWCRNFGQGAKLIPT